MTNDLKRIFKERSGFYKCEPSLFRRPGLTLIAEESLQGKNVITLATVDRHLMLRYDPVLDFPFEDLKGIDQTDKNAVLKFLTTYFEKDGLISTEPFYYFYKLDNKLSQFRVPRKTHFGIQAKRFDPTARSQNRSLTGLNEDFGNAAVGAKLKHEAETGFFEVPFSLDDLKIRRVSETDYPAMNAFFEQCTEAEIDEADIYLDEPDPVIFCGFLGDQIVAYASHRYFAEGIADIGVLVHPDHRKKGYGKAMVSHDTQWCLENDIIAMYRVWSNNGKSVSLVKALGFTRLVEVHRLERPES